MVVGGCQKGSHHGVELVEVYVIEADDPKVVHIALVRPKDLHAGPGTSELCPDRSPKQKQATESHEVPLEGRQGAKHLCLSADGP